LNDALQDVYECQIDLDTTIQQLGAVYDGDWAGCFDLKAGYYQIPLKPAVRKFFAFPHGRKWYTYKVLPMGFSPAAEICDVIIKIVSYNDKATVRTHIDNVKFTGTRQQVEEATAIFLNNVDFVGAQLNDEPLNEPHRQGKWLGVLHDHAQKSVKLPEDKVRKIESAHELLFSPECTCDDVSRIYGLLQWASTVMRAPLHRYYTAIK
jgi:hypothetical protein